MNRFTIIIRSFLHYLKPNLLMAAGVAVSTAVLTGGLIIGDSVTWSLEQMAKYRLGNTTQTITSRDRFFRQGLAYDLGKNADIRAVPVLLSSAVAMSEGGVHRANKVQVAGIDSTFEIISGNNFFKGLGRNDIIISENLAERLAVSAGDDILLRIKKESLIPLNAPFVSDARTSVSFRATIKAVATKENLGRFSLKNSQTAPYNVFMSIGRLNDLMGFRQKANTLLINSDLDQEDIGKALKSCWMPSDAGLILRHIKKTGENEIISDRVFLDTPVFDVFGNLPGARGILTYFVNGIINEGTLDKKNRGRETPYSFVSTLPDQELPDNQIMINRWLANDLNARVGDSLLLNYFVVGPLRKLEVRSSKFVVTEIVGMESRYADSTLMPELPGLSDAGHCRDWNTGVPVDLDKIRDKDEAYWDKFRGMPKAFISIKKAQQLWSNRFGSYTAVRFDQDKLNADTFLKTFRNKMNPASLGFVVIPVKANGMKAAQNGVDFSQLFLGLSFFLLLSAILLSALLFLLNFENRSSQIGTLMTLGFRARQVRRIFLTENIFVSMVGGLFGLIIGVIYTHLVFRALNSLWNDIVRTNALEVKLRPGTLLLGFVISILIAALVVGYSLHRRLKQQLSEVQKNIHRKVKSRAFVLKLIIAIVTGLVSVAVVVEQFGLKETQNPSYFFMSGGLLLVSLLLFADYLLDRRKQVSAYNLTPAKLSLKNATRNKGRSLSILILFAIGTFLVISTGANRQDLFSGSDKKSSGTGGFLYFAETTIPVLSDLNDPKIRANEGLSNNYHIVQFRKMEGDDASCLNLNRVSNPAILGVDPNELSGRFSFAAVTDQLDTNNPWSSLEKEDPNGVVPAIADQTVIQWGLGKKVGDTLFYQSEAGDTIPVRLIGGLAPSIFQGNIIISNKQFLKYYPSSSGSRLFLIDGATENKQAIADELNLAFRDYGWEQVETAQRLADFYSVTNTYLSIFLALGALALILGTLGLAIVLARSILERKAEIALLQAVGFEKKRLFTLLVREYLWLLTGGILIGLITSVLATLPAFLSSHSGVSVSMVLWIVLVILINGIIWISVLTWMSLRKRRLIVSLRSE